MDDYNRYVTAVNKIYDYLEKMKAGWNNLDNKNYIESIDEFKSVVTSRAELMKKPPTVQIEEEPTPPPETEPPVEQQVSTEPQQEEPTTPPSDDELVEASPSTIDTPPVAIPEMPPQPTQPIQLDQAPETAPISNNQEVVQIPTIPVATEMNNMEVLGQ